VNASEKNVVRLALCLLVLGIAVRIMPWGLPSIESFEVGDSIIVSAENSPPEKSVANAESPADNLNIMSENDSKYRKYSKKDHPKGKKVVLPIHINTASVEELCALNGVGPKLAEKILGVREANGPFKTGEDLKKVPGIGKKKLEKLLPGVIFD
jgi:competence protein ComEA